MNGGGGEEKERRDVRSRYEGMREGRKRRKRKIEGQRGRDGGMEGNS